MQSFGPFAPDAYGTNSAFAAEALGVLPGPNSYRPWPQLAVYSAALAAACRGAVAVRTNTNSIAIFAGTATKLYKLSGTAWTDVSRAVGGDYAVPTDEYWGFIQYGANLIAFNSADTTQVIDVNSGTNFAALSGSPPRARYGAAVGDIVMLADTNTSSLQVKWSGRNNAEYWTAGQRDSDAQTFGDGGFIQGITGVEQGGLILQTETVRRFFARPDRAVFEFHRIEQAQGTRSPYSVIPYQGGAFYFGQRGFVAVGPDGASQPIGNGYVDEWFIANSNYLTRPKAIIGAIDPKHLRFFWLFAMAGNATSTTYDHVICFDPAHVGGEWGPWSHAEISAEYVFPAATTATTLENLGSAGLGYTLETVPYSLDSDIWKGGAPVIGFFDSAHKLNWLSGSNMEAVVQTAKFQPIPNRRAFVRGFKVVSDAGTMTGRVASAAQASDTVSWGGAQSKNAQGMIPARASGRYAQMEVTVPAGTSWTHLSSVDELDVIEEGER